MENRLKHRLVGAAVLLALAVIFLPFLLDGSGLEQAEVGEMPPPPASPEPLSLTVEAPSPKQRAAMEAPPTTVVEPAPEAGEPPGPEVAEREIRVAEDEAGEEGEAAPWVVQAGSFGKQGNALELRDRLRESGLSAFVEATGEGEGRLYRVRIGPWLDRGEAESVVETLADEHGLEGLVIRHE